ncbi:hypothetical protein HZA33_03265 [Candidatus Pacearchaeota archaeon]|nr:hypothetical protein [Candidatus Pacearchaeota archaeon]
MKRGLFVLIVFVTLFSIGFVSALQAISCIDSDSGRDYTVKGTIVSDKSSYTDHCVSFSQLAEYYCSGENIIAETVSCPCEDGRCVSCSDSDNGKVIETFGEVFTSTRQSYFDSCLTIGNQVYVKEYFCLNDEVSSENIPCNGECYAGVCHTVCNYSFNPCSEKQCGLVEIGCGKNISCGACSSDKTCVNNICISNSAPVEETKETITPPAEETKSPITSQIISNQDNQSNPKIVIVTVVVLLIILFFVLRKALRKKPKITPEKRERVKVQISKTMQKPKRRVIKKAVKKTGLKKKSGKKIKKR